MSQASYHPFWPGPVVGDVRRAACDAPDHWIKADVVHSIDVPRGNGITERRYICVGCLRTYVVDAVTT